MKKSPYIIVLIAFLANSFGPIPLVQAQLISPSGEDFRLPAPGVMVHLSPPLDPPILKGIKVNPNNPFHFDFILDQGDSSFSKTEANKLIKYFLAGLTIPEKDLWVNLSPYEKDRIVPGSFGRTEMGRDLLAEDYMLKQITASLIYPEGETGKKFWKQIYEEASKRFGTTNVPVNTFNKVWIVPEKAVVYENAKAGTAYVIESKLKVMLEQDYLALSHTVIPANAGIHNKNDINLLGSQITREIVIPELTKEVNEGKNFTQLRQVYNSLILATWYKRKIKDSILAQVYEDQKKIAGVEYTSTVIPANAGIQNRINSAMDPRFRGDDVNLIYQRYLRAFKKGVFNYIKEEPDPMTQETIPRKYFSGGVNFAMDNNNTSLKGIDGAMTVINVVSVLRKIVNSLIPKSLIEVKVDLQPSEPSAISSINVPPGYELIGGESNLRVAERLKKTIGREDALLGHGSPLADDEGTLEFMDVTSSYIGALVPNKLENDVLNVLEIGSGTGLVAMTAFHQAIKKSFKVNVVAVDIDDQSVENTRKNFELLKDERKDQDNVHIFKIRDDGDLGDIRGKFDLILFNAADVVPKEKLTGILMDQGIFERILKAITDRLLAEKGVAIIGNQKSISKALIPNNLRWDIWGTSPAGVYSEKYQTRVFLKLSFKDFATRIKDLKRASLDGFEFSKFVTWMNDIADATTSILSEETLNSLAKQLKIAGQDLKTKAILAAQASRDFYNQLPKDGKIDVYLFRDAFGLYMADRTAGGSPLAMPVSNALIQKLSGESINGVLWGIINEARFRLGLELDRPIPKEKFEIFKNEFFQLFDALVNEKDIGKVNEANRIILDKRSNLRLITDYLSTYAVKLGITTDIIQNKGVRFIDSSFQGTFVLLMEAVAREMMNKAGVTANDVEGKTDSKMFYSSLSQALGYMDINDQERASMMELDSYPVELKGIFKNFDEEMFVEPKVQYKPSETNKFLFFVTALKSELLKGQGSVENDHAMNANRESTGWQKWMVTPWNMNEKDYPAIHAEHIVKTQLENIENSGVRLADFTGEIAILGFSAQEFQEVFSKSPRAHYHLINYSGKVIQQEANRMWNKFPNLRKGDQIKIYQMDAKDIEGQFGPGYFQMVLANGIFSDDYRTKDENVQTVQGIKNTLRAQGIAILRMSPSSGSFDILKEVGEKGIRILFKQTEEEGLPTIIFQNNVNSAVVDRDAAMKGGIDLTPANMNVQVKMDSRFRGNDNMLSEEGIKFHLDPAMLRQLQNAPGLVPVIINIQPLKNLGSFLGVENLDSR